MFGSLATTSLLFCLTNARFVRKLLNISQFYVIKINHLVQMIIDIADLHQKGRQHNGGHFVSASMC